MIKLILIYMDFYFTLLFFHLFVMVRTTILKGVINKNESLALYEYLKDEIEWESGILSKKGFTRLAKPIALGEYPEVDIQISNVLNKMGCTGEYLIYGIYLNYYVNGDMWTPNHSHQKTQQLVISLGETRKLSVSKKVYEIESGDAILFGSSVHGVPKEENKGGRISIATFMTKL
jgi:hypothetical protein